jgi:hypothetical protein
MLDGDCSSLTSPRTLTRPKIEMLTYELVVVATRQFSETLKQLLPPPICKQIILFHCRRFISLLRPKHHE